MTSRATRRRRPLSGAPALSLSSRALLALAVVGSVLAVGAVHVPVLLVVSGVATAAALCAALSGTLPRRMPGPAWLIVGLTLLTLLQIAPLPLGLLEKLAPGNADVWAQALLPFKHPAPTSACLSLDPGASLVEVLKGWTYLTVFLAAAAAGARRGGVWGAMLLGGSALLLALATIGHAAVDATRVFGIYQPHLGGQGMRVAPLIDPNNLAGYLNLGILCMLSLLAMARPPLPRWLLALAIAPTIGVSLLTGSRGGLLCLVGGAVLLLLVMRKASQGGLAIPIRWNALAGAGGLSAALALLFAVAATGTRLQHLLFDDNLSKLSVAVASGPLIRNHLWLGIGRGAFESVFPAYHAGLDNAVYSHPENFVVQWLAEWGLPATVILGVGLSWLLRPSKWGITSSLPACGLFCGAVALLIQNLVDLSFEIPGVAIALWAAAGLAWGYNAADGARLSSRPKGLLVAGALLATALTVISAVSLRGLHTLALDRELALAQMPSTRSRDTAEWTRFRDLSREIVSRHPAEPYFFRLTALAAWRVGGENPLPWLRRALERGMSAGRTHYLLGAYLGSRHKTSQALFELRLAVELDPQLTTRAAKAAVKLTHDREQLLRLATNDDKGAAVLIALARELRDVNCADSLELVRESARRDPQTAATRLTLARWLLAAGKTESACPPLERAALLAEAEQELTRAATLDPTSSTLPILRARALLAGGRAPEAVQLLKAKCPASEHRAECISAWIESAARAQDSAALAEAGRLASADGCEGQACARVQWSLGEAAQGMGDMRGAVSYFEKAANEDGSARRWRQVGRAALSVGESARALRAFETALALAPGDMGIRGDLEKARRQAVLALPPP